MQRLEQAHAKDTDAFAHVLAECRQLELYKVTSANGAPDFSQYLARENSGLAVILHHLAILRGETGAIDGPQRFRQGDDTHRRQLGPHVLGKNEGHCLLVLLLTGDRGGCQECNPMLWQRAWLERQILVQGGGMDLIADRGTADQQ